MSSSGMLQVNMFVTHVVDLLGWEAYSMYDMAVIKIVDQVIAYVPASLAGVVLGGTVRLLSGGRVPAKDGARERK